MTQNCKQCKWEVKELNLDEEQNLEILGLLNQDLKLLAIQKLNQDLKFNLKDSKGIVMHLNKDYGNCIRCDFDKLVEENVECPKCKAFNYNLKFETSFNQEFCEYLERRLNFDELESKELNGFWCDGIDHIPSNMKSLLKVNLVKNREIKTNAWIGKDGQGEYKMTIKFGNKSIENYKKNQSLVTCIPIDDFQNWVFIEPDRKEIEVKLI